MINMKKKNNWLYAAYTAYEMNEYQKKHPNNLTIMDIILFIFLLLFGTLVFMFITKAPFVAVIISFIVTAILSGLIEKFKK
jgi:Na+/H+ antiporter NhaC